MGFFDELEQAIDVDGARDIGFWTPEPGIYNFEVSKAEMKRGTQNDPDALGLSIGFALQNSTMDTPKTHSEYNGIPQPDDPHNPTEREAQQAAFLKKRFLELGIPAGEINHVGPEDILGITGTLSIIIDRKGYAVIRNVKVGGGPTPAAPVAKKAPARAPRARKAIETPAPEPETAEVEPTADGQTEEEAAALTPVASKPPTARVAKPKPDTTVGNPFA